MDNINHTDLISGFNNLKQLEISVKSAQKMVGTATMSMDEETLQHAENSLNDAKDLFKRAYSEQTGVDDEFFQTQEQLLQQCEQQLNTARQ
ncbi:DUF2564 family protein [Metabacillus fastidiosus]|uniref:DUF2564 family protein n=1 Tax=Metabacillus fastidiosus TaxID=1458 RepID=UPI003D2AF629